MDRQDRNKIMSDLYEAHRAECKECSLKYPFGTCDQIADVIILRMSALEESAN